MLTTMEHSSRTRNTILMFGSICILLFGFSLVMVHADRLTTQSCEDCALNGPPQSISFHSNRDRNPNQNFNEIYVMNPDGSEQTRVTFDPRVDQQPHISPNGKQIVFASNRITPANLNGVLQIFLMNTDGSDFSDGSNVKQLTFTGPGTFNAWPRWSPNGKEIAFHSSADGNFEIYTIQPDGTSLTRVTNYAGLDQFPGWAPNGKQLVIRRDTELFVIDKDGSNPIRLTFTSAPAINQMASWSPNGKMLAFLSSREGYLSVFLTDPDGSNQINLTPKPSNIPASMWASRAPAWSKNGQHIYFTGIRPETCHSNGTCDEQIFVMNADGSGVTELTFEGANSVATVR